MAILNCQHRIGNNRKNRKGTQGFTLVELVLVIIILGIMAVGISGFITLSTQTYLNATNRDELIGNARFVIERLSRELRNAVPNSIRIESWAGDRIQCIQFIPIVASTIYTDIPVSPELASKSLSVIPFEGIDGSPYDCDNSAGCTDLVTAYPLNSDDLYADPMLSSGKLFRVKNVDTSASLWKINIANTADITFDEDSPTQRLYFANEKVSYCNAFADDGIWTIARYVDDINEEAQTIPGSKRFYMAGYLIDDISSQLPFNYQEATLQRNAVVQIHLEFVKDDERYVFDHEVHINNVP
jgi:MSHA biogenesis protein MshO